jgi:hypothetical protein
MSDRVYKKMMRVYEALRNSVPEHFSDFERWETRGIKGDGTDCNMVRVQSIIFRVIKESEAKVAAPGREGGRLETLLNGFFSRYPNLSEYQGRIRFREREQGGSSSHGEARQHGGEIWLFPKFWTHGRETQDFILAHEIGHWVKSEFRGRNFIALAEEFGIDPWDTATLPFAQFNMDEAFADAFGSYHTDGDVKHRYPSWARLVEVVESMI